MKRLIAIILCMCFYFSMFTPLQGFSADAISNSSVFLKQEKSDTCTLASATMMLRRRAYLEGNSYWSSINESVVRPIAWSGGLKWDFTYSGMRVVKGSFANMNQAQKKEHLISLLNAHPEGIVIYMYGDGKKTHAVLATDYDSSSGTVYCADPAKSIASGRIPLTSAYLTGNSQNERIGNLRMYWYVKSGNCNLSIAPAQPSVHTHSYNYSYDNTHPHASYKYCSCGYKEYTGAYNLVASCSNCHPIGNLKLTRSVEKTEGKVTFYRNNADNVSEYELVLMKNDVVYNKYSMSSDSKTISNLSSGQYFARLNAKNSVTGQERTAICQSFSIADTYSIVYNANGGNNAPANQTKIQDSSLTLSSSIPEKKGYRFLGWSTGKTSSNVAYYSGDIFTKNTDATLYAVWEPEVYTISFDANGGDGGIDDIYLTYGNTTLMPNAVVKSGYYLKGWSVDKSSINPEYELGKKFTFDKNTTLYAIWGSTNWSGAVASDFAGGTGTENDPYLIADSSHLALLAKLVNSQTSNPEYMYYKLTSNIDLGYNEWVPIGIYDTEYQYFYGSFDGNGYTISGLYISADVYSNIGLFGRCSGDSTILKNLTLTGDIEDVTYSESKLHIGALVGEAEGVYINNIEVKNFNISTILNTFPIDYIYSKHSTTNIGFICGQYRGGMDRINLADCFVTDCAMLSIDTIGDVNIGGIVGLVDSYGVLRVILNNCFVISKESIFRSISHGTSIRMGGIAGSGDIVGIYNCYVECPRLIDKWILPSKYEYTTAFIGGIAADAGIVRGCAVKFTNKEKITYNSQQIPYSFYVIGNTPRSLYVSGIALSDDIKDCKYDGASIILINNASEINASSPATAGGISASGGGECHNCIVNIDGIVSVCTNNSMTFAGGLIGRNSYGSNISKTLILADKISAICTSGSKKDSITGGWMSGGFAGDIGAWANGSIMEKCYTADDVLIEATTATNEEAILKSEDKIKTLSFQTGLLGLSPYQSLAHIDDDAEAVWILKDGELPDLYYSYLKEISIRDCENGTVSTDKEKAVPGELVTINAVANDGYILDKIFVNDNEINGTSFILEDNSSIYAHFIKETEVYTASVEDVDNASATLANEDAVSTYKLSALSSESSFLSANDGDEIRISTTHENDYTIDALYVNGEEIVGNSFILTENSVITMDVANIKTDVIAITDDAQEIGDYFAVLSGSVTDDTDETEKYIRYWKNDDASTVYTTSIQTGPGEYVAEITNLEPETAYSYQMTEYGEIKSFMTCSAPNTGDNDSEPSGPEQEPNEPDGIKTPTVSVINARGRGGKTVDVTVKLSNNPGIATLKFLIGYDASKMELSAVTANNDVFATAEVTPGVLTNNPYTYLAYTATANKTTDGNLVTLSFLIKDNCAEGAYAITLSDVESYTIDESPITFTLVNGVVTVKNVEPGDVTGDGNVNTMDLLRLGKYFAGWSVEIDEAAADVTGDGKINTMDLLRLGKYFAGWSVTLG